MSFRINIQCKFYTKAVMLLIQQGVTGFPATEWNRTCADVPETRGAGYPSHAASSGGNLCGVVSSFPL
jgi:hypothetical protein